MKNIIFSTALATATMFATTAQAEFLGEISPSEAFDWASNVDNVHIVDVRTLNEWVLVGHPGPSKLVDSKNGKANGLNYNEGAALVGKVHNYPIRTGLPGVFAPLNPNFVTDIQGAFDPSQDTLLFICRSGSRAAAAADLMALEANGNYMTYNIADGFEGPTNGDDDPGRDTGYRDVSGWVNDGLPYNFSKDGGYGVE
jgi:rhodanese-related sulfurtransferase